MKTGTEALSARLLSEPLPASLILPRGNDWPQTRTDVAKHPEMELLGTRRGAPIERRLEAIVAEARTRDVPEVTILLVAEALNVAKYPDYILQRLSALADSLVVVFFARYQTAALPSIVAHRVQSWTSPSFVDLDRAHLLAEAKNRFHYDRYLQRWSGDGHELIALPYFEDDRKTDGLMERFTNHTGIVIPAPTSGGLKNVSLGMYQLLKLGELKAKWAWMRGVPVLQNIAATLFYANRTRIQAEAPSKRWTITASERRSIEDFYRDSNAEFKRLLGSAARRADWKRWFAGLEAPRT